VVRHSKNHRGDEALVEQELLAIEKVLYS